MGDKEYGTMSVTEQLNREIDRLKAELEESRAQLVGWPDLFDENMRLSTELAEARAEIHRTYKAWCGRDYMHLPLNEAVGAVIKATEEGARQEAARECYQMVCTDTYVFGAGKLAEAIKAKFKLEG